MSLLALDVGFKAMGWAVMEKGKIKAIGIIETKKSPKKSTRVADDYSWRSGQIATELNAVIDEFMVKGIVGELPSGGAQNASAMAQMNMATAIVSAVAAILGLPVEWCTPNDVKLATTGYRSATKRMIMDNVAERFGGSFDVKRVKSSKAKCGFVERITYHLVGERFPGGVFEHIADSLGAYLALKQGNLVKIYG